MLIAVDSEMVQAIFEPVTIGLGNLIQEQIDMVETEILAGKLSTVHSIKVSSHTFKLRYQLPNRLIEAG